MQTRTLCTILAATTAMAASLGSLAYAAVGVNSTNLRTAVTLDAVRDHQRALQAIADANSDTRASGTPGFEASVDYVFGKLEPLAAYYNVVVAPFDFAFFRENAPAELQRISPSPEVFTEGTDFSTMQYSGSGTVDATVHAVGPLVLPPTPDPSSASGCAAADFAGFVAGRIALIQRGTCTFAAKAANAQAAGAAAVIIFNEGNPGRTDNFGGTLGGPVTIPVLSASFSLGEELAAQTGIARLLLETDTTSETRTTSNIIAETKAGRADRVVVPGAHLDSVIEGPGINDNGSGSAGILEIAIQMAKLNVKPRNKVRFMWFGAEEEGLLGSEHYVSTLNKRQIKNIAVNLNFDMIGSPNPVRFVYDGDGSSTPQAGPNGSAVIEDVFLKYFASQSLATEPTAFDGRSDYGPFIDAGIPAGGLFTGAEEIKTPAQAAIFGGIAGLAFDPCYHQPCDIFANNNDAVLDVMADAVADSVLQFAMTTSAVKGTSQANDKAVLKVSAKKLLYKGRWLQK